MPQASEAVADPSAALILEEDGLQPNVLVVPEAIIAGGVTSIVLVISWLHVAVLPQPSVAL